MSFVLITILVGLLIAAFKNGGFSADKPGELNFGTVLLGVYILAWGAMFLASYYFSHKSFFLRALVWVCENMSSPSGKGMAIVYFLIAFVVGTACVLSGLGIYES